MTGAMPSFVTDLCPVGSSEQHCFAVLHQTAVRIRYLGMQNATRKTSPSNSRSLGRGHSRGLSRLYIHTSQEKWDKGKQMIADMRVELQQQGKLVHSACAGSVSCHHTFLEGFTSYPGQLAPGSRCRRMETTQSGQEPLVWTQGCHHSLCRQPLGSHRIWTVSPNFLRQRPPHEGRSGHTPSGCVSMALWMHLEVVLAAPFSWPFSWHWATYSFGMEFGVAMQTQPLQILKSCAIWWRPLNMVSPQVN
jgi:hypothetical protein